MRKGIWLVIAAALIASPLAAANNNVIYKGVDLFHTPDGSSYMDFSKEPIPSGFFCSGSKPFAERVVWRGVPVATGLPGELGRTDTIIERLDNAAFNKKGVAATRIRFKVLQLESATPIKTECGSYTVRVVLDGDQPTTRMRILRESKAGGHFLAPLALRAKFVFIPLSPGGKILELPPHEIRFPVNPKLTWAFRERTRGLEKRGGVLVDTDFDSIPDTYLVGTSNFAAGWDGTLEKDECPPAYACHKHDPNCLHCIEATIQQ